jgi:hypothetical protein
MATYVVTISSALILVVTACRWLLAALKSMSLYNGMLLSAYLSPLRLIQSSA